MSWTPARMRWFHAAVAASQGGAVDVEAPSAPGNLAVSARTATSLALTWDASTDNVAVVAYEVEFQLVGIGIYGPWETTTLLTSTITGLLEAHLYHVRVRAVDAAGNVSAWSTLLNESTADETTPTVPGNLAASSITATGLTLTWTASTDNVGVTEYEVQQRLASGVNGDYVTIGTVAAPTVTLAVTGLANDTGYRFRVRARDAASNVSAWGPSDTGLLATTLPLFVAPHFSAGAQTIIPDGDGTGYFVVGANSGNITDANGTTAFQGLAKLDLNGKRITSFAPVLGSGSSTAHFCAVDTVNRWLYVVGGFTLVDGVSYNRCCRFDLDTLTIDATWNPNVNNLVRWCGLDANGDLIIGGAFTQVGVTTRNRLARISRATGVVDSWNPNASSTVTFCHLGASDLWVAYNGTTTIGGQTRPRVARLNLTTGAALTAFNAQAGTGASTAIYSLTVIGGDLYVVGQHLMSFAATVRGVVAKLNATTGALDTGFDATPSGTPTGLNVVACDGELLVLSTATTIGGAAADGSMVLLDPATGAQSSPQLNIDLDGGWGNTSGYLPVYVGDTWFVAVAAQFADSTTWTGTSIRSKGDSCVVLNIP